MVLCAHVMDPWVDTDKGGQGRGGVGGVDENAACDKLLQVGNYLTVQGERAGWMGGWIGGWMGGWL